MAARTKDIATISTRAAIDMRVTRRFHAVRCNLSLGYVRRMRDRKEENLDRIEDMIPIVMAAINVTHKAAKILVEKPSNIWDLATSDNHQPVDTIANKQSSKPTRRTFNWFHGVSGLKGFGWERKYSEGETSITRPTPAITRNATGIRTETSQSGIDAF